MKKRNLSPSGAIASCEEQRRLNWCHRLYRISVKRGLRFFTMLLLLSFTLLSPLGVIPAHGLVAPVLIAPANGTTPPRG